METDLPLEQLQQIMSVGDVISTSSTWDDVMRAFRYKTVLTDNQKRHFRRIFRRMAGSLGHTNAFLRALKASMLARPRVTRRFLEQVLPPEYFPRSLHAHAGWKDLAFILDYLRYLFLGVPSKHFQKQLAQYAEPRQQQYQSAGSGDSWQHVSTPPQQHWNVVGSSPKQHYHSARSSQQIQGGQAKKKSGQNVQIQGGQAPGSKQIKRRIFERMVGGQERTPHFYFQLVRDLNRLDDEDEYESVVVPLLFDMNRVYAEECPDEKDKVKKVVDYIQSGLNMTHADFGQAYLVLNEMECKRARDAFFSVARLIFEEMLRRREDETGESVDKKSVKDILDYLSNFNGLYRTAQYLWFKKYDKAVRVLQVMGWPVPDLSWGKIVELIRNA